MLPDCCLLFRQIYMQLYIRSLHMLILYRIYWKSKRFDASAFGCCVLQIFYKLNVNYTEIPKIRTYKHRHTHCPKYSLYIYSKKFITLCFLSNLSITPASNPPIYIVTVFHFNSTLTFFLHYMRFTQCSSL